MVSNGCWNGGKDRKMGLNVNDYEEDRKHMSALGRRKLIVFLVVSYGLTLLMDVFLYIGYKKEIDLSNFLIAQMMYPLAGVIIGKLFVEKDRSVPKGAFVTSLITTVLLVVIALLSVFFPMDAVRANDNGMTPYYIVSNLIIIVASVLFIILHFTCGAKNRKNAGLSHGNFGKSAIMIILFVGLYALRFTISVILSCLAYGDSMTENFAAFGSNILSFESITVLLVLVPNYFFTSIMFLGEEYGWRYYLQPIMQKKFGMRAGVVLLGLIWGLWHAGADMFFYTTTTGPQMIVSQLITCVSIGIFLAYAYMKTQNIWVPVILHYINNNLIPILKGDRTTASMQGSVIEWMDIPLSLVASIPFILFILAPVFSKKSKESLFVTDNGNEALLREEEVIQ